MRVFILFIGVMVHYVSAQEIDLELCIECCESLKSVGFYVGSQHSGKCKNEGCEDMDCGGNACLAGLNFRLGLPTPEQENQDGFLGAYECLSSGDIALFVEAPTVAPTTRDPTISPTESPTAFPTSAYPTPFPIFIPPVAPTNVPSAGATNSPTTALPTANPTTSFPTENPTTPFPTESPTNFPTTFPSSTPTYSPLPEGETRSPTTPAPTYVPPVLTVPGDDGSLLPGYFDSPIGIATTIGGGLAFCLIICMFVIFAVKRSDMRDQKNRKPYEAKYRLSGNLWRKRNGGDSLDEEIIRNENRTSMQIYVAPDQEQVQLEEANYMKDVTTHQSFELNKNRVAGADEEMEADLEAIYELHREATKQRSIASMSRKTDATSEI